LLALVQVLGRLPVRPESPRQWMHPLEALLVVEMLQGLRVPWGRGLLLVLGVLRLRWGMEGWLCRRPRHSCR